MNVTVAPDSFGGTLSSRHAAEAIAAGWRRVRPEDAVTLVPLADGGEGTLDAVAAAGGRIEEVEVAGPWGRPVTARLLLRDDRTAVIESAEACGLHLVPSTERDPLRTTTYGVGQLLEVARTSGARRVVVGLGGSATVDGGAGALTALGMRIRREGGGGLKIGGAELAGVERIETAWLDPGWREVEVVLWADVRATLDEAAATYGPQKGATPEAVDLLGHALERWADVVERDLGGSWRATPGSGAAGGLGFGLLAGLDAVTEAGAAAVAREVGFDAALAVADLVITGEGRLDATSFDGKVVGYVLDAAAAAGVRSVAVVGRSSGDAESGRLDAVEESSPDGIGVDAESGVVAAAERLARRI